ncbi:hypothetical protein PG993_005959 [Apiospora rasikravindrae]|uniref:Uncharacterized protein n=1 Tax=Apiospora rasikravindrae TaxID=990691 RepID=A0ABR1TA87_9PEZI
MPLVPLTWGCASVHSNGSFSMPNAVKALVARLRDLGITRLDCAQLCGDCGALLGRAGIVAPPFFAIDSKHLSVGSPAHLSRRDGSCGTRRSIMARWIASRLPRLV